MALQGHATSQGTKKFYGRATSRGIHPSHFREFDGLNLTSLGMGTYLGEPDSETDRLVQEAVKLSVKSGAINVIDTAINYRFQKGERSVGRAVREMVEEGSIGRDELMVCTKNGYLTHDAEQNLDFWSYIHRELIKPGIIKPDDITSETHCMTISFLSDQLMRSISNLSLECIDLVYLHNAPESQIPDVGRQEFMNRLRDAFSYYEEQRREGRIRYYGLATWSSLRESGREGIAMLSLEEAVRTAQQVGGSNHGFRFIQLPFNLAMPEALTSKNQYVAGELVSCLEACMRLGVGVFTSAPLLQGGILRYSELPVVSRLDSPAHVCIQFARSCHPSVIAPLVGQKEPSHVADNIGIGRIPPMEPEDFARVFMGA